VSREALLDAITRFQQDELSLAALRARVLVAADEARGGAGVELRSLAHGLEAIELNVCEAERRGAVLEQLEPVARALRARVPAA
jgi:hypothetical protein